MAVIYFLKRLAINSPSLVNKPFQSKLLYHGCFHCITSIPPLWRALHGDDIYLSVSLSSVYLWSK